MDSQDTDSTNPTTPTTVPRTDHESVAASPEISPAKILQASSLPPSSPGQEPTLTQRLTDIQDHALLFLANASNETLGACAIGLCASTYLVLGRVGLVLIGAVGGVVLHATWEQHQQSGQDEKERAEIAKRRREQGLDIAKRALDWRNKSVNGEDSTQAKIEPSALTDILDYSDFLPETKQALTELTDAVIRDYVKWWYSPVLPTENAFPASCRQILTGFILSFSNRISRKRTEDPFLDFIANSTSIVIVFLNELGTALKASPNQEVTAAIRTYLEYEPESSLANVLSVQQQERKLRLVAEDILTNFLDSRTYNCAPAQVFLREVLSALILEPTIVSCSKAEWINGWIVYMLENGEPEIMNVIDAGVENLGNKMNNASTKEMTTTEGKQHKRRVSRAEEAMQDAMREAQRLNEMIAEDEARRRRGDQIPETESIVSAATTDTGIPTPTSSDSELNIKVPDPMDDMLFDAEGNNIPSGTSSPARLASPIAQKIKSKQFTSFDQLASPLVPTALQTESNPPARTEIMSAIPLTLHNANITILDMGTGNDKVPMRVKPNDEFLVQIEPTSSRFPGWMITRRYPDFEPLHEILRRIAVISGVPEFNQAFDSVPTWKGQTRYSLIAQLEVYLKQALKSERLAESEAMRKFLDKDTGLDKVPAVNKNVLLQGAAALDNVGKGFINVLGQGGKNIAGGGKAVFGGVQGVFGAVGSAVGGPKKMPSPARLNSTGDFSRTMTGSTSTLNSGRPSLDFVSSADALEDIAPPLPTRPSLEQVGSPSSVRAPQSEEILNLPPPPSEIDDEFVPATRMSMSSHKPASSVSSKPSRPPTPSRTPSMIATTTQSPPAPQVGRTPSATAIPTITAITNTAPAKPLHVRKNQPLTEEETRITVDLVFAIITSTYSLSSAWTFRLSLLSAAKTFILRPNNPQLDSIRVLLQESLINNNTSDPAVAGYIRKLRENSLPTEDELARWPKEMAPEEKEKLRVKARKLLVERGMPQALTSVMGQAASGEALGKVFDCLQVEEVARGLIFAVLLQAVRAVI